MDKPTLRPLVFEILRKTPQTHLHAIETEIRRRTDDYERHDVLTLQEILWELLVQGVLAPGKNSLNLNLPFVHLTAFGVQCLEVDTILPHDPDGYIERLQAACGEDVDPLLIETTREALLAYLAGRYPSSAVMLGRSAWILLHRLGEALIEHGRGTGRGVRRLEAARHRPRRLASTALRAIGFRDLAPELVEDGQQRLRGLRILLEASHRDDGRPPLPRIDRETTHGYLLLFPQQCQIVYHLVAALEGESSG